MPGFSHTSLLLNLPVMTCSPSEGSSCEARSPNDMGDEIPIAVSGVSPPAHWQDRHERHEPICIPVLQSKTKPHEAILALLSSNVCSAAPSVYGHIGCMRMRSLRSISYPPQPSRRSVKGLSKSDCTRHPSARVLFARLHTPNTYTHATQIVVNHPFPPVEPTAGERDKAKKRVGHAEKK